LKIIQLLENGKGGKMKKFDLFSAYIRLEQLNDEVKQVHGIKQGANVPRFDVTHIAGYYEPFEALKNSKGQIILYLNETKGVIKSPDNRRADRFLMGKNSLNISSIFLYRNSIYLVGYGNPYSSRYYGKQRNINPFFEYRNDGFLFLISPDWKKIDFFVIKNGKNTIIEHAQKLVNGYYDEVIKSMREGAAVFYNY